MAYWAHCGKTLSSYFNLWDKTNFEDKHHLICYAKSRTMLLKLDAAYKKKTKRLQRKWACFTQTKTKYWERRP